MPVLMLAPLVSITGSVIGGKGNEKVGLICSSAFFCTLNMQGVYFGLYNTLYGTPDQSCRFRTGLL